MKRVFYIPSSPARSSHPSVCVTLTALLRSASPTSRTQSDSGLPDWTAQLCLVAFGALF